MLLTFVPKYQEPTCHQVVPITNSETFEEDGDLLATLLTVYGELLRVGGTFVMYPLHVRALGGIGQTPTFI